MAARFKVSIEADSVRIAVLEKPLLGKEATVARAVWRHIPAFRPVSRAFEELIDLGAATGTDYEVHLSSQNAAALAPAIAECIRLPPLAALGLAVALEDRIETPNGRLCLRWTEKSGQEVRPERIGILLRWGQKSGRLSLPLLRIAEAADGYNRTVGEPPDQRIAGWMPVQSALRAATAADVRCDGFLDTFTILQAGSFALDVHERPGGVDFTPILMSRDKAISLEDDAPSQEDSGTERCGKVGMKEVGRNDGLSDTLLSPSEHHLFLAQAVGKDGPTRDAYRVGRNRYVLIDSALRRALDVVKAKRGSPSDERRAFLRNPRAALAEALDLEAGGVPTATLFIETKNYSDRVDGLGLWEQPRLPWLTRPPNAWLPEAGWTTDGASVEPEPLTLDQIQQIADDIETAEVRGDTHVVIRGVPIPVDAAPQVLAEERHRTESVRAEPADTVGTDPESKKEPAERLVLIIKKTNFDGLDYYLTLKSRRAFIGSEPPADSLGPTVLKPHQVDGFRWLVQAWQIGWPGVLLADDMGLGKTFQALAFLTWIRENAAEARRRGNGSVTGRPLLVVAPTALLKNWEKECADRLSSKGLGERLDAYGKALSRLKLDSSSRNDSGETLDVSRLREADWILTTYETLTDHERAFARIPYSIVLFDEMQKVKAPDTLNTKAAKALNADFVLGLTGTPIENRMEDLWCLFDRIVPGYLGDLKTFSKTFRHDAVQELTELKAKLDAPVDTAPPVMKRRMKADILVGLPGKTEIKYPTAMPDQQAQAYRELIVEAREGGGRSRGFMLGVLHAMRGLSLHPQDPATFAGSAARFEGFARRSARLATALQVLRDIANRREKALVFIENLAMQDVVAEGIAALFDLDRRPAVINGGTPGEKRLAIVNAFEQSPDGFGVLVLSPKAAGVGLNIVAANHVIHLSRWWNPAVEDQCNDRVYRIGQNKPVTIHIPMATHPDFPNQSFDEELDRLIESKRQLSRHMLAPPTNDRDVEALYSGTIPQPKN
jgi:superfamily II DNA or RNA helicase